MKRYVRLAGIGLGALAVLLCGAASVLYVVGGSRVHRRWDVAVPSVAIPTDSAAIARGRHLATAVTFCHSCHGENLGGTVLEDSPAIVTLSAPNLTAGAGGIGAAYEDADYVRAIRHGVNRDGRGLMVMHSDLFNNLGADDLGAIIAYVKSSPSVDNLVPPTRAGPLGRILVPLGVFDSEGLPLISAEHIDHAAPLSPSPAPAPTAEYGEYLLSIAPCRMCHGAELTGGLPLQPGWPPAPNIAVLAASGAWSEEQFVTALRTGVTPARTLNPEWMPWEVFTNMTDEELHAIWLYLQTLDQGTR